MAAVLAWWSCDHLGRWFEGDLLSREVMPGEVEPLGHGGLLFARRLVCGGGEQDGARRSVLDWHLGARMA